MEAEDFEAAAALSPALDAAAAAARDAVEAARDADAAAVAAALSRSDAAGQQARLSGAAASTCCAQSFLGTNTGRCNLQRFLSQSYCLLVWKVSEGSGVRKSADAQ